MRKGQSSLSSTHPVPLEEGTQPWWSSEQGVSQLKLPTASHHLITVKQENTELSQGALYPPQPATCKATSLLPPDSAPEPCSTLCGGFSVGGAGAEETGRDVPPQLLLVLSPSAQ